MGPVTTLVDWSDEVPATRERRDAMSVRMTCVFRLWNPSFPAAGFGGVRGPWEFNPFLDCGQLARRCPRSPHSQHKAVGLGASTLGLKGPWVGSVGLARARTATNFSSIVAMWSTSASRGEMMVAAAT